MCRHWCSATYSHVATGAAPPIAVAYRGELSTKEFGIPITRKLLQEFQGSWLCKTPENTISDTSVISTVDLVFCVIHYYLFQGLQLAEETNQHYNDAFI